jgi:hypothetical protein
MIIPPQSLQGEVVKKGMAGDDAIKGVVPFIEFTQTIWTRNVNNPIQELIKRFWIDSIPEESIKIISLFCDIGVGIRKISERRLCPFPKKVG